ncbi:MAG: DHA2 family efflux MFS transporter permease subunit [Proteobacteria bacterium]|nr:DHA2 family efflux MFS transporter permease subunit [Pseudomonadota bacterium]
MYTVSKPADGPFTTSELVIITLPVLAASLLHAVNMSTAYVALPSMQGNLSASPDQISWVITAFVVASAVGTILTGWVSQRIGRRQLFLASIVGFTVTSMLCALSTSLGEVVLMRALQGFVSAPLLPVSQAIMLDTYPKRRHGFAMSIWSMGMILGPVVGPTLGAMLTEWYDWRYVFFMNVPLGLLAFVGIFLTLPATPSRRHGLDWIGVISLILAVVCLQMVLDRGERLDWFDSLEILIESAVAALAFYILIAHSLTAAAPYINLSIFRDRNYVVGVCLIFIFGIAVFSSLFILPLFLQNVQDYPVLAAGWMVSMRGVGTMIAMLAGGILAGLIPAKYLILSGLACVGVSAIYMTGWNAEVSAMEIAWLTMINGFGVGIMWVTLTTVTFSTLNSEFRTEGAALFALIRAIGASMGTSVIVAILVRSTQVNYSELRDHINPFNESLHQPGATAMGSLDVMTGIASLQKLVAAQAETIAYLNAFTFLVLVAFAAMPLVFLLKSPRGQ